MEPVSSTISTLAQPSPLFIFFTIPNMTNEPSGSKSSIGLAWAFILGGKSRLNVGIPKNS